MLKNYNLSGLIFIKKYFLLFIYIFLLLLSIFVINILAIGETYSELVVTQMKNNVYEYKDVDLEQLCRISNCKYIIKNHKIFPAEKKNEYIYLGSSSYYKIPIKKLFLNYYISENNDILIYFSEIGAYFALSVNDFLVTLEIIGFLTFLVIYLITFIFLFLTYNSQKNEFLLETLGTEALISNQSMIIITENVHHEMNTPLEVIENKIIKIEKRCNSFGNKDTKDTKESKDLDKDFEFIKLSLEQVFCTLDKMRGFKHLKYSNGNKTIYDIVLSACKIMTISNSGFEFDIDENLKNYTIKQSTKTLANIDLLNIIINHLKNSSEAQCSKVIIKEFLYSNNMLNFIIVDDGNGIPSKFLSNVFKPNLSTKSEPNGIRGNGMYLNKFILNSFGGDVKILDTSINGTIVEISIPSKLKESNGLE